MAGAFLQVEIRDEEVRDMLTRLMSRVGDLTPVMRDIGEVVQESVQRNFEEHRAPDGSAWQPLAESTKKQRKKLGRDEDDILILNRILMGSIHPKAEKDRVVVGTDIVYAAIHQFGGSAGRGRSVSIPKRPFLGVRDEDWDEIEDTIQDFLFGSL